MKMKQQKNAGAKSPAEGKREEDCAGNRTLNPHTILFEKTKGNHVAESSSTAAMSY
jgi:hypothetical protein